MSVILTVLAALVASGVCAYHRAGLRTWFIVVVVTTLIAGIVFGAPWTLVILLLIEAAIGVPLLLTDFRSREISAPLLKLFAKVTPSLSATEQTALEAGTVGFEGELFSGRPDWHQLLRQP
jgi:acyl-CoA dehydrogenase